MSTKSKVKDIRRTETDKDEGGVLGLIKKSAVCLVLTLPVCLLVTACVSAVGYSLSDPSTVSTVLGLVSLGLSSFIGGIIAVRRIKCGAVISALLGSVGIILVSLLAGVIITGVLDGTDKVFTPIEALGLRGAVVVFEFLGALVGGKKEKRPRIGARLKR